MDSRLTPSSARNFGQEIVRSPGTRTNRKSSSPRRTTNVFTTSAGVTPRASAASARLRTGPSLIRRYGSPEAARASSAGLGLIQYLLPAALGAAPAVPAESPLAAPPLPGAPRQSAARAAVRQAPPARAQRAGKQLRTSPRCGPPAAGS